MEFDRRAFLASLASAGILTACGGSHQLPGLPGSSEPFGHEHFGPDAGGGLMPLQIVNKTPYPDTDVFFYVVGKPDPDKPAWVHMTNAAGATKVCVPADAKNGYVDYSLKLSDIANRTIQLPSLHGGRMYFSIKEKLKIPAGSGAFPVPGSPPGWVGPSPNYGILFDNWEFTLDATNPKTGFNYNATQVDMLGIPMSIRGIGKTEDNQPIDRTIGFPDGARTKIFAAMKGTKGFEKLVIPGKLGDVRVIAPNLGIPIIAGKDGKVSLFNKNYFDAYINEIWTYFKTKTLSAETSQGTFVGQVNAQNYFAFALKGKPTIFFKKPTTQEVFECNMQPDCGAIGTKCPTVGAAANLAAIEIKGALPAAINRSTLPSPMLGIIPGKPACNQSLLAAYKKSPTNFYSKIMHQFAIKNAAYGFGNDDVCAGSSYVAIRKPTRAIVTLSKF
jgi:Beta-1,3-glucanase